MPRGLLALAAVAAALLSTVMFAAPAVAAAPPGWTSPTWTLGTSVDYPWNTRVAVSPSGDAIAVWTTGNGPMTLWSRSRPAGGTWLDPVAIHSSDGMYAPELAVDGAGNATLLWLDSAGSVESLLSARLAAGTDAWSAPHILSDEETTWGYGLAAAPDGGRLASWLEDDGGDGIRLRAATGNATSWNEPQTVSAGEDHSYGVPAATIADGGDATLVWNASVGYSDPQGEVWAARDTGAGWTKETLASNALISFVRAAGDGDGRVAAAWYENDEEMESALRVAFRENGSWSVHDVSSDAVWGGCGREHDVAFGSDGRATAVWQSQSTVWGLSSSHGDSTGWSQPRPLWQPLVDQYVDEVRLAGGGGPIAVWTVVDFASGGASYEIRAAQRAGGGWVDIPGGPRSDLSVFETPVGSDAAGNALVGWAPYGESGAPALGRGIQATPPRIDELGVPAAGEAGAALAFSVRASSVFARVERATWNFGDGSPIVAGDVVSHAYARDGDYTVTVSVADSVGHVTTTTRRVRVGKGGSTPRAVLNPPFVRQRGGVVRVKPGTRSVRVRLVNRDSARLTGVARLARFARAGGRPTLRTLSLRRGVTLPRRGQRTVTFRLSKAALRALRAAPKRSYPVRIVLRMRAADGRTVRSAATFTLDGRDAFRKRARPGGAKPRPTGAGPLARRSAC